MPRERFIPIGCTVLVALAAIATPAVATDRHVPGGYPTVQVAIDASAHGDRVLLAAGDYTGPGNQDLDFGGRNITLQPALPGTLCRLLPEPQHRAMIFDDGEGPLARVVGITITGGAMENEGGTGVLITNSSPTIIDCVFSFCATTGWGGAVRIDNGNPTFARCLMLGNTAARGGAVHFDSGSGLFRECTFQSNMASNQGGAVSHGTEQATDTTYAGCHFVSNFAGTGGGIAFADGQHGAMILGCRFLGNQAADHGGGVRTGAGFSGEVTNCLFIFNTAFADGRAWFDNGGDLLRFTNCSISVQFPDEGDKNAVLLVRADEVEMENCIVWGNGGTAINANLAGSIEVRHSCIEGGFAGEGNFDADPRFDPVDPLALRLLADSPCLDAGWNDALPPTVALDIDGNPRLVDGNGDGEATVDMGAYERPELPACNADLDEDGQVDFDDLVALLSVWGACPGCPADLDGDGVVGFDDLVAVLASWGPCPT